MTSLNFGDKIENGSHVLAYTGLPTTGSQPRGVALCWFTAKSEFAVWNLTYTRGEWIADVGRFPLQDFARALEIYKDKGGTNISQFIYGLKDERDFCDECGEDITKDQSVISMTHAESCSCHGPTHF